MFFQKCRDSAVSNHKLYPTFARTIPSTYKVSKSVISLMKYFGWTHFQAVVGESTNWKEAATTLVDLAKQNEIDMSRNVYFSEPYIGANEMPSLIERTYRNTRSGQIFNLNGDTIWSIISDIMIHVWESKF